MEDFEGVHDGQVHPFGFLPVNEVNRSIER